MNYQRLLQATAAAFILPLNFASQVTASPLWISTFDQGGYVNLRRAPSTAARIADRLTNATPVEAQQKRLAEDGYYWYQVDTGKGFGWIRSDFTSPVGPVSPRASQNCNATLDQAEQRLQVLPNAALISSARRAHRYGDGPINRPQVHEFLVTGPGSEDIMTSPVMQTQISAQLIQNCPDIGLVRFSMNETDWREDYGLMHGGMVRAFRCREAGAETSPIASEWGERVCI